MQIPFFQQLTKGKRFLIVGAGGGYDITHGIPLYLYLTQTLNKQAVLANFSFTNLAASNSEQVFDGTYKVTTHSNELDYFPEKKIVCWLQQTYQIDVPIYAFDYELGVQPLRKAYNYLIAQYDIDTILLVDGGTDSVIFGDEEGLGTIVEDANSMIAAVKADAPHKYLAAIGFGIDHFHNVNHYNYLENVATLIRDGGYLGAFSLTKDMLEGKRYLELTEYLNRDNPKPSIVNNCIAGALAGDFGDVHYSPRTASSELFINPLMPIYWTFNLADIVKHMEFAELLENAQSIREVVNKIQIHKIYRNGKSRFRKQLPL